MPPFTIRPIVSDADFEACYALMQHTFPAEELVDAAEYRFLLRQAYAPDHAHWFVMLARWTDEASPQLVGLVAGSYMVIEQHGGHGMAMIEYLAIAEGQQHQGHSRALLAAFEAHMQAIAHQRHERLGWIVGEVDDDLLPFKFHLGYGLPEKLRYAQPPIAFDAHGQPCYTPVPKHLVMKPMQGQRTIEASVLRAMIRTMYRWRYMPLLGDEIARQQAAEAIEAGVYQVVAASIAGAEALRLRYEALTPGPSPTS